MVRGVILLFVVLSGLALWRGWPHDKPKPDDKSKPPTAQATFQAIQGDVLKLQKEAVGKMEAAKDDAERQKIKDSMMATAREKLVPRMLSLAEQFPKSDESVEALEFVLFMAPEGDDANKAADLLLTNHPDKLAGLCEQLGVIGTPAAERLLRGILAGKPDSALAASATLGLAKLLKQKSESDSVKLEDAKKLSKDAEELCATIVDKYKDQKKVLEPTERLLFELRNLAVGKVAPEIAGEDADSKAFKLTDYRGKVVVLDFWAEW